MGVVGEILITLMSPASIAEDKVPTIACSIFLIVFKTNKVVKLSILKTLLNHGLSWKCEDFVGISRDGILFLIFTKIRGNNL